MREIKVYINENRMKEERRSFLRFIRNSLGPLQYYNHRHSFQFVGLSQPQVEDLLRQLSIDMPLAQSMQSPLRNAYISRRLITPMRDYPLRRWICLVVRYVSLLIVIQF